MPDSERDRLVDRTVRGRANRFGYFHPPDAAIAISQPGEYRVDVTASFVDEQGTLWMGSRTWGGVVAATPPAIIARVNEQVGKGVFEPDIVERFSTFGYEPLPLSPADVVRLIATESRRFGGVIKQLNLTLD